MRKSSRADAVDGLNEDVRESCSWSVLLTSTKQPSFTTMT